MKNFVDRIRSSNINAKEYGLLGVFILIVILFQVRSHGILLSGANPNNLISQNAQVVILAIGMLMVIIAGHIDLSVGSVVAVIGALIGLAVINWDLPWLAAIPLALVVGALIGAWQGFWVAYVKVPAFIVTLAGMLVFRGANILLLTDGSITPLPKPYQAISNGHVPGFIGTLPNLYFHSNGFKPFSFLNYAGPDVLTDLRVFIFDFAIEGLDILTLVVGALAAGGFALAQLRTRAKAQARSLPVEAKWLLVTKLVVVSAALLYFSYLLADYQGTPYILLLLSALIFAASFVLNRTVFGRHIYAIGGNRFAAMMSGVKTKKVDFFIFVNIGMLAALTAIVATARTGGASTELGKDYELDAIAAVFVGGAAVQGGVGKVSGVVIGALVMGVLNMGLSITKVDSAWIPVIKGFVLLFAVAFDIINRRRAGSA